MKSFLLYDSNNNFSNNFIIITDLKKDSTKLSLVLIINYYQMLKILFFSLNLGEMKNPSILKPALRYFYQQILISRQFLYMRVV